MAPSRGWHANPLSPGAAVFDPSGRAGRRLSAPGSRVHAHAMAVTAVPVVLDRARWAATIRELVQLRREEAAAEENAEDAMADELRRAFHRRPRPVDEAQPPPAT